MAFRKLGQLFSSSPPPRLPEGTASGSGTDNWSSKAITSLEKKLRSQPDKLTILNEALRNPESVSQCVTIPTTKDGRLQVDHKKRYPHFVYCKVWRWPDLGSHLELKGAEGCQHPLQKDISKMGQICINPFHYERVAVPTLLPPVEAARPAEVAPVSETQGVEGAEGIIISNENENAPLNEFQQQYVCEYQLVDAAGELISVMEIENALGATSLQAPLDQPTQDQQQIQRSNVTTMPLAEPEVWGNIRYYELNSRVGEPYQCRNNLILIDGYTDPGTSSHRFSIGALSNVNRNSVIKNTRNHIGKGLQIIHTEEGVYIQCLSYNSIFVYSPYANYENGASPSAVVKCVSKPLPLALKIFDFAGFQRLLLEKQQGPENRYEEVQKLVNMCMPKVSFVKGWGEGYYRKDITTCPCWMELDLRGPLQQLDEVLRQIGSPDSLMSSVS